ncbi:MAG: hypothetical protein F4190_13765 [Acidimicrobiales bacterium]|nr:hypothetical protein [Acidimicrobiales bacterium]MYG89571.1 hypothetical protein [Acidimicrobiales bacterium]MYI27227.1 hypothetical protein [Acidimicrobiales bacterium]
MTDELEQFPAPRIRDHARAGVQAAVSALPLGGTVNQLFDAVMAPSVERRQIRWFKKLAEIVDELRVKVDDFDLERLADNEVFVTAVLDASRIAVTTHREEKLTLLKSVLVRLAVDSDSDEFLALQMLRFVDALTPEHFVVLKYWANPRGWFEAKELGQPNSSMGSPSSILQHAQLPIHGESLEIVHRDLSDFGLAQTDSLNTMVTQNGMWAPRSTELGNRLLEFASEDGRS